MNAETLFNRIRNESKYCNRLKERILSLRRMVDEVAEMQAKDNAEWHDDPGAEDHAEFHASAEKQFSRATRDKAVKDLVTYYLQEEIYEEHNRKAAKVEPTITSVKSETAYGSCTLTALFSDFTEKRLFSFYIDELCFSNDELIGLTEGEAHALRRSKDVAYLRS